jgi:secreted Zn-dependent insulinase-like peptidase
VPRVLTTEGDDCLCGDGQQLRVNGYNQKLPLLAEKIVEKMRHLEIKQDRFNIFKEKVGERSTPAVAPCMH